MSVKYTAKLDLTDNGCFDTGWRIKQGDFGDSKLVIKVVDNGVTYYSASDLPSIVFRRADGKSVIGTMTAGSNSCYEYEFLGNELEIAGTIVMDVKFGGDDDSRTSTASCKFTCVEDTFNSTGTPADIYPGLTLEEVTTEATRVAEEVASKATASFEITSASPLNGCSASSIVGIDVCGNSTQSGTPTPTNPIAIVDASGDVIAHSVNILDKSDYASWYASDANWKRKVIDVLPNTDYTLSTYADNGTYASCMLVSSDDVSVSATSSANGAFVGRPRTVTSTSSGHIVVAIHKDFVSVNMQIEKGNSASDYSAYGGSNKITLPTLRSVGNVKDELIVNGDGSGQIIKRIGVKDLSTLTWAYNSSSRVFVCADDISALATSGITMMCSNYKGAENVSSASDAYNRGNYTICGFSNTSNNRLYIRNDDCTTVEQLNATFTNCVFRYALKTPTTTTLTASEVSAIRALQTYSGTTIVDSALDVKSVTYHAGVKEYIDWRFEQLATLMLGEE